MSFFGFDGPFGGMPSMFSDGFFADSDSDDFNNYSRGRGSGMNGRQRSGPIDNETYYKVLGVDKDATTADIHKAFRKQAMKHHPDRGGDAQTFQLINEAHEVLSDAKKRKIYDAEGKEGLENPSNNDYDMEEEDEKGDDIRVEIAVNLETLYTGHSISVPIRRNEICPQCQGTRGNPGAVSRCPQCKGKGHILRQVNMGFFVTQQAVECAQCHGSGNLINRRLCCQHCRGEGVVSVKRNVDVYIEPGLKNRSVIRVSEQGHQLLNKRAGDLVVIIKEKQHQRFKRANCDLGIGLHISVFESLLGFKQRITHLDGHIVEITNPPGVVVKPGNVYKIEEEGMPVRGNTHIHGALFVTFHVDFPDQIDPNFVQDIKNVLIHKPSYIPKLHRDYLLDQNQEMDVNRQYESLEIDNDAPVNKCVLKDCVPEEFGHTINIENNASSDEEEEERNIQNCSTF